MISTNIKDPQFTNNNNEQLVNIFDFNPKKLRIKKVTDSISDNPEYIYYIKVQAKIYNQIWDKIKELINNVDGVNFEFSDYFRNRGIIIFNTDDTLLLDSMVNVYSMTIFIKSIYRTYYNRFYPQIHLANCIYKEC